MARIADALSEALLLHLYTWPLAPFVANARVTSPTGNIVYFSKNRRLRADLRYYGLVAKLTRPVRRRIMYHHDHLAHIRSPSTTIRCSCQKGRYPAKPARSTGCITLFRDLDNDSCDYTRAGADVCAVSVLATAIVLQETRLAPTLTNGTTTPFDTTFLPAKRCQAQKN